MTALLKNDAPPADGTQGYRLREAMPETFLRRIAWNRWNEESRASLAWNAILLLVAACVVLPLMAGAGSATSPVAQAWPAAYAICALLLPIAVALLRGWFRAQRTGIGYAPDWIDVLPVSRMDSYRSLARIARVFGVLDLAVAAPPIAVFLLFSGHASARLLASAGVLVYGAASMIGAEAFWFDRSRTWKSRIPEQSLPALLGIVTPDRSVLRPAFARLLKLAGSRPVASIASWQWKLSIIRNQKGLVLVIAFFALAIGGVFAASEHAALPLILAGVVLGHSLFHYLYRCDPLDSVVLATSPVSFRAIFVSLLWMPGLASLFAFSCCVVPAVAMFPGDRLQAAVGLLVLSGLDSISVASSISNPTSKAWASLHYLGILTIVGLSAQVTGPGCLLVLAIVSIALIRRASRKVPSSG